MSSWTRTWAVPTSPRSPYKLPATLRLLEALIGQKWNRKTQRAYAKKLKQCDDFEGHVSRTLPDWSARDRVNRAPLTFGLVSLEPAIAITPSGQRIMDSIHAEEVWLRQLLKWQYPSPKHGTSPYQQGFHIRPFLEALRLAYDCSGLTKEEIALFAVPLTKHEDYEGTRHALLDYRAGLAQCPTGRKRQWRYARRREIFRRIYRDAVRGGRFRTRQSQTVTADQFVEKKYRNAHDYADAAMRYFRATGLFSLSARTTRLTIRGHRRAFVEELLRSFPRDPEDYRLDLEGFLRWLGDPSYPRLPSEQPRVVDREVQALKEELQKRGVEAEEVKELEDRCVGVELRGNLEEMLRRRKRELFVAELRRGRLRAEVSQALEDARRFQEGPFDRALFFEWNLWRALETLGEGKVSPNLLLDEDCQPLENAPGRKPDLEIDYGQFVLVVEGTLSSGRRQHDTERESVARHYGDVVQQLRMKSDTRPVYGLFVAPQISSSLIAYFFMLRKQEVIEYGGKARFVPLSVGEFNKILLAAEDDSAVNGRCLFEALQAIDQTAEIARNEREWHESIASRIAGLPSRVS